MNACDKDTNTLKSARPKKLPFDKKHLQGFVAGVAAAAMLLTGVTAAINPGFLTGAFTKQAGGQALQQEVDMQDVSVTPQTVGAGAKIEATFSLNIPADALKTVSASDVSLWGYFEGLDVTGIKAEEGRLKVTVQGAPGVKQAYDYATDDDKGYIAILGEAAKESGAGYQAGITVAYPRFTASPEKLTAASALDTGITLTLRNDAFTKTPEASDITLDGGFKNMALSGISQSGGTLTFHIKGSSVGGSNGSITVSGNVLRSGVASQKIIPISGTPLLYSISPATVAAPFADTLVLRLDNDSFQQDVAPEMFTLGGKLAGATVSQVQYIDNTDLYVTLSASELRETGQGTITLSGDGLQGGQSQTARISVAEPSISAVGNSDEILAAPHGEARQYTLTISADGNNFRASLSPQDFVLKGALASSKVTAVKWLSGFQAQLTIVGSPQAGQGIVSVRTAALGGITGAECPVNVGKSIAVSGQVNLSNGLSGMRVTFYGKDGKALDIPAATTVEGGSFYTTVTSEMPVDDISYVKASNGRINLTAPFRWDERDNVNINAFTSLMQYSIAKQGDKQKGIQAVSKYLGLPSGSIGSANYIMLGKNDRFSHVLFEEQANGDVDGYLKTLQQEMEAGKTHSFAQTIQTSGQTGGLLETVADWGLQKMDEGIIAGIQKAASAGTKTTIGYALQLAGIQTEDTDKRLDALEKSIADLRDQLTQMQDVLSQGIKEVELADELTHFNDHLSNITALYRQYQGRESAIKAELAKYMTDNQDNLTDTYDEDDISDDLPYTYSFFGIDDRCAVRKSDVKSDIDQVILQMEGSETQPSLITDYYGTIKGRLPFEVNAASELKDFVDYVDQILNIGIVLYDSHCQFTEYSSMLNNSKAVIQEYKNLRTLEETGSNGQAALLPSKDVFTLRGQSAGSVSLRLNRDNKVLVFPNKINTSDIVTHTDRSTWQKACADYIALGSDGDAAALKDLADVKEEFYPNMSMKDFLVQYGGLNPQYLPKYFLYSRTYRYYGGFSSYGENDDVTVYNMNTSQLETTDGSAQYTAEWAYYRANEGNLMRIFVK